MTLPAGYALNALIAEKVMGWAADTYRDTYIFLPSSRIADAWEVIGHLQTAGYGFYLYRDFIAGSMSTWWAEFLAPSSNVKPRSWRSDTAPHAICLAALKAVEA